MAKHTTSRPTNLCFLVIKQISTGHVRKRRVLLTPTEIDAYKLKLNKPENGFVLIDFEYD
jgi:hypothetical protein